MVGFWEVSLQTTRVFDAARVEVEQEVNIENMEAILGTFTEKLHRELIFTDILMIGLNIVWFIAIFSQMIGAIPREFSGILSFIHFCFGIPSITWYLGLRARWKYTPKELEKMVAFHTSGHISSTDYSDMSSTWHNR